MAIVNGTNLIFRYDVSCDNLFENVRFKIDNFNILLL